MEPVNPTGKELPADAQPIERVQENMLARGERWLLNRLCARMPNRVTPDMLTFTGMVGALAIFAGYAAKRMGLNVCGVDMLRSNHGPVIMEVNSSPGLEGIENATGKDIAGMIIDYMAANAKVGKTKTKGQG